MSYRPTTAETQAMHIQQMRQEVRREFQIRDRARVRAMVAQGYSVEIIANRLGLTEGTVRRYTA